MGKIIIDSECLSGVNYPIQPKLINTNKHFWDSFGNNESEVSARLIVSLCQKKDGWFPFTKEEAQQSNFRFNKLSDYREPGDDRNYIILGEDGRYRVTHEFITACFKSSPNI